MGQLAPRKAVIRTGIPSLAPMKEFPKVKKIMSLLSMGAALVALPVLAAPADQARSGDLGDKVVTRVEAQARAAALFAKLDVNKDGRLDEADRQARRAAMRDKLFDRLDANKDGSISKAEWDQAAAAREAKRAEWREKRSERGARATGEGGPRPKMRGHRGRVHGEAAKPVTQAEFVAAALTRFDRMDANKDGKVTPEERQAFRQAMRAKRRAAPVAPAGN